MLGYWIEQIISSFIDSGSKTRSIVIFILLTALFLVIDSDCVFELRTLLLGAATVVVIPLHLIALRKMPESNDPEVVMTLGFWKPSVLTSIFRVFLWIYSASWGYCFVT